MPILPKIVVEPTREYFIGIYWLISGNAESVASNLGGGRHVHLALTVTAEEYLTHMSHAFIPPQNPVDYPPTMGAAQEQALITKRLRQNQSFSDAVLP